MTQLNCENELRRGRRDDVEICCERLTPFFLFLSFFIYFSFGAGHDDDQELCKGGINIMAAVLPGGKGALKWSPCTKNLIQAFLRSVVKGGKPNRPKTILTETNLRTVIALSSIYKTLPRHIELKQRIVSGSVPCTDRN